VRVEGIVTMSADLPLAAYPTGARVDQFATAVVERLNATPGVERAAVSTGVPLLGVREGMAISPIGRPEDVPMRFKRVDPHYFDTLDIPVVAGRGIASSDREGAPIAIVINQTLARALNRAASVAEPVGQTFRMFVPTYEGSGVERDVSVVGIIRDERTGEPQSVEAPVAYGALAQSPRRELKLVVRTSGDPAMVMNSIRATVKDVEPRVALGDVRTMEEVRALSLTSARQPTWVIGAFAVLATVLAGLGLYGVLAHAVAQERRSLGIRLALGARPRDVGAGVVRQSLLIVAGGVAVGAVAVTLLARLVQSLLFGVSPLDPIALAIAGTSTLTLGAIAAAIPALRAARVDPSIVLRGEN